MKVSKRKNKSVTIGCFSSKFIAIPSCPAKIEGLVHYPTTLAPVNGSMTVTTQCADNAHIRSGSSLNVTCDSNGSWSGLTPVYTCDVGHHITTVDGRQICQGEYEIIKKF